MLFAEVATFLEKAAVPAVVILDDSDPDFADRAREYLRSRAGADDGLLLTSLARVRQGSGWANAATVVVVAPARAALRRGIFGLPGGLGRARTFVCAIEEAPAALVVRPRPEWPDLGRANARRVDGGSFTVLRFTAGVPVRDLLQELARQVADDRPAGHGGLVAAYDEGQRPFGAEPAAPTWAEVGPEITTVVVPPDVVVASASHGAVVAGRPEVTDRAPCVLRPPRLEPCDEMLLNPIGFSKTCDRDVVVLGVDGSFRDATGEVGSSRRLHEGLVASLRDVRAVEIRWPDTERLDQARVVAGLALAGVPLAGRAPEWAAALLGPVLTDLLAAPVDLVDPLRREEHSVRLRRAAFAEHSVHAWRRNAAERAGVRFDFFPAVTVVLATKRPHLLADALDQLAAQQQAGPLEVVVAAHGFEADPAVVRERLGCIPATTLSFPAETMFGDVLEGARRVASGDLLLKVDDDDWYGRLFVHDLLAARHYARADVVGTPAEFVYLEQRDLTVRRPFATEVYNRHVAGGTILVDRAVLHETGGFRSVRRSVDAQLLGAAAGAGARIYRTHGLGYLLRRAADGHGHTWVVGDTEMWRADVAEQRPGFSPSALLEGAASTASR